MRFTVPVVVAAAMTMSASVRAQTCFDIPTHYSSAAKGYLEKANDDFSAEPPTDAAFIYPPQFLPQYEAYIGQNFTVSRISAATACGVANTWKDLGGRPVEFRQPASYTNIATAKQALSSNASAFQVLPNLVVGKNVVTIVVPPGWSASSSYPIVATGFYSTALTLPTEGAVIVPGIAKAMTSNPNYRGAIAVLWNGRGDVGSRTADAAAVQDFVNFVLPLAESFGGDRNRLILEGGSRGGITALRMAAATPTKLVLTAVSAGRLGDVAGMTSATVPDLIEGAEWSIGIARSWKTGWKYPDKGQTYPTPVGLRALTRDQAHLKILTGTADAAAANSSSASPASGLSVLAQRGTQVHIQVNSHDAIVPWLDQYRLLRQIRSSGIVHQTVIGYGLGHGRDDKGFRDVLAEALLRLNDGRTPLIANPGATTRYLVGSGFNIPVQTANDLFTIEYPKLLSPLLAGNLHASGQPGTVFQVTYRPPGFLTDQVLSASLGADGTYLQTNLSLPVGTTTIKSIKIQLPGSSTWKEVTEYSSTQHPTRNTVEVLAQDPLMPNGQVPTGAEVAKLIKDRYLGVNGEYAHFWCPFGAGVNNCRNVTLGYIERP